MRICTFLIIMLMATVSWGRACSIAEVRQIDTNRIGSDYSPYPVMSRVSLLSPVAPLVVDTTKQESNTFWTLNFFAVAGWVYYATKNFVGENCEDERNAGMTYYPSLNEIIRFHEAKKDEFWEIYTFQSLWVLGIVLTSESDLRKTVAAASLGLPWIFAFNKKWSAFTEKSEMHLSFNPVLSPDEVSLQSQLSWNF